MPANHTIWILGDSLLTEAAGYYTQFKKKKDSANNPGDVNTLYIENMYAIKLIPTGLYTAQQASKMPNIILNNLVDTLNIKAKVPHTIVIVLNDHRFWNNADILQYQMNRILSRFIKEIKRIAEARNLSLPPKAVNWDYPRIFITRALPLPNNMSKPYPKGFRSNRRKYNRLLLRGEEKLDYKSINLAEFTCENSNGLFQQDGTLTPSGYISLWTSISDAVHKSDNHNRILLNKAKAKQLSEQITVTSGEVARVYDDDGFSDLSDVEPINAIPPDCSRDRRMSKARRALVSDFNANNNHPKHRGFIQSVKESPRSDVSEYFTRPQYNNTSQQHVHHRPQQGQFYNSGYQFQRRNKHQRKSTWRDNRP